MEKPIAAIELGSKKVKLVIGYELNGKPYVLYTLSKPYGALLIENGKFIDAEKISEVISDFPKLVDPTAKLKINISDIVLILPPYGLEVLKTRQTTGTTNQEGKITTFDIKNLYAIIRNCHNDVEKSIVDIVPQSFVTDQGTIYVSAPVGESSRTIQVFANVHTSPTKLISDYNNIASMVNLKVKRNIISSFSAVELLKTDPSIPESYFLVDIGSNTTTVSLVGEKTLISSAYFNWGGDNITSKIISSFNINESEAEKYKTIYGIDKRDLNFKAPVCVTTDIDGKEIRHSVDELNGILESELDVFVNELNLSLTNLTRENQLANGLPIILVGGGSRLYGLVEYISPKINSSEIRTFVPSTLGARDPSFTNCLGAILICGKYPTIYDEKKPKVGSLARDAISNEK